MKTIRKYGLIYFFFALFCFIFIHFWSFVHYPGDRKIHQSSLDTILLRKKVLLTKLILNDLRVKYDTLEKRIPSSSIKNYEKLFRDKGIGLFILREGKTIFWTTDQIPLEHSFLGKNEDASRKVTLLNGKYLVINEKHGNYSYVACILLEIQYPYQNEYLINDIHCSLKRTLSSEIPPIIAFFFGYILFLLFLQYIFKVKAKKTQNEWYLQGGFIIIVVIIRFIQLSLNYPSAVYENKLFSPALYASSFITPSLGDLLIDCICLFFIAFTFYYGLHPEMKLIPRTTRLKKLDIFIHFIGFLFILIIDLIWIKDIVVNSSFSLELGIFTGLNGYSLLGILAIGIIILSLLLFSIKLLLPVFTKIFNQKSLYLDFLLIAVFTLSVLTTVVIQITQVRLEKEKQILLAKTLTLQQNPLTEYYFAQMHKAICLDSVIIQWLTHSGTNTTIKDDSIDRYIKNKYLKEYWNRFNVQITLCDSLNLLTIQPRNIVMNCNRYFLDVLKEFGRKTAVHDLYFMDYGFGYENYLFLFHNNRPDQLSKDRRIYLEFSSRFNITELGYPELLIDKSQTNLPDISGYSYAVYQHDKLSHGIGPFNYPIALENLISGNESSLFFKFNGMNHLNYRKDKDTILIISRKQNTPLDFLSTFSYMFILLTILTILVLYLERKKISEKGNIYSLKARLQITMIGTLVLTFLIIGVLITLYLIRLNAMKNETNLREKSLSIMVEMQHKIGDLESLDEIEVISMENLIMKFSNVFFTDINIYSPNGFLFTSSRPQIFDEGLISKFMNPIAFDTMNIGKTSLFIHQEKIGSLRFNSSYISLLNDNGKLLGFMNLPYFSRQGVLRQEITDFLIAFTNIYIVLILLGIILSILISRKITYPLVLLSKSLSSLQLGIKHEKIKWSRNDEIGRLVDEYNRMLDELTKSLEKLALSERENAWKEMARQVAHEIKNPLTPMKLSIQYLKKSWENRVPDWDTRLKRFIETLSEQIDQLAEIAGEFSDFAKMPEPVMTKVDMKEIILESIRFYQNLSEITITYDICNESCTIKADKKQIIRIISNLLNNSIQAISNYKAGVIHIVLNRDNQNVLLNIEDNGCGIPEDQLSHVFRPYFTTRSNGTGLGLVIVKGLIKAMEGTIRIESVVGKGTTVYISLPLYQNYCE